MKDDLLSVLSKSSNIWLPTRPFLEISFYLQSIYIQRDARTLVSILSTPVSSPQTPDERPPTGFSDLYRSIKSMSQSHPPWYLSLLPRMSALVPVFWSISVYIKHQSISSPVVSLSPTRDACPPALPFDLYDLYQASFNPYTTQSCYLTSSIPWNLFKAQV